MTAVLSILLLCGVSEGELDREDLMNFKRRIDNPEWTMQWLRHAKNRDAIDLVPPEYKDLRKLRAKYFRKIVEIHKEMREKYPYRVDHRTGQFIGEESRRAHDRYLKAVDRASAPVLKAWRKEMRQILSPEQIAKMHEIQWQQSGARLLFEEDFQRVLKLSVEQRAALDELWHWAHETPEGSRLGMLGTSHPIMVAKMQEAKEKALRVLTKEQRKAFEFLLGRE